MTTLDYKFNEYLLEGNFPEPQHDADQTALQKKKGEADSSGEKFLMKVRSLQ